METRTADDQKFSAAPPPPAPATPPPAPAPTDDDTPRVLLHMPVSIRNAALIVLAAIAVLACLRWAAAFFIPVMVSFMFSYALSPVVDWLERLQVALQKVERSALAARSAQPEVAAEVLVIQDRGRTERVPLTEVLYFKAELKYVTVRTAARSYILDASLSELEEKYSAQFMRVHRNALVARNAVRALEKHDDPEEGDVWAVRLNGIDELLAVSRRQLSAVREALAG